MNMHDKTKVFLIRLAFLVSVLVLATACGKSLDEQIAEQLKLGQRYLSEMKYEEAIVAFNKVIELDPKNTEAYKGLADAYVENGQLEEALEILENAPDDVDDPKAIDEKLKEIQKLMEERERENVENTGDEIKDETTAAETTEEENTAEETTTEEETNEEEAFNSGQNVSYDSNWADKYWDYTQEQLEAEFHSVSGEWINDNDGWTEKVVCTYFYDGDKEFTYQDFEDCVLAGNEEQLYTYTIHPEERKIDESVSTVIRAYRGYTLENNEWVEENENGYWVFMEVYKKLDGIFSGITDTTTIKDLKTVCEDLGWFWTKKTAADEQMYCFLKLNGMPSFASSEFPVLMFDEYDKDCVINDRSAVMDIETGLIETLLKESESDNSFSYPAVEEYLNDRPINPNAFIYRCYSVDFGNVSYDANWAEKYRDYTQAQLEAEFHSVSDEDVYEGGTGYPNSKTVTTFYYDGDKELAYQDLEFVLFDGGDQSVISPSTTAIIKKTQFYTWENNQWVESWSSTEVNKKLKGIFSGISDATTFDDLKSVCTELSWKYYERAADIYSVFVLGLSDSYDDCLSVSPAFYFNPDECCTCDYAPVKNMNEETLNKLFDYKDMEQGAIADGEVRMPSVVEEYVNSLPINPDAFIQTYITPLD